MSDASQSPENSESTAQSSDPQQRCHWQDCDQAFADAETLYSHLCNDHIGRKSTNNLCLTCKWKDCGTSCAKRDHITSHLRVHTPLKPHICEICKKTFKRPQDLKKHEKIHTEEHHAQHKHSKAITKNTPGNPQPREVSGPAPDNNRAQSYSSDGSGPPSSHRPPPHLNTPSPTTTPPNLRQRAPLRDDHRPNPHLLSHTSEPSWEETDYTPSLSGGSKRSHSDYSVDRLITDMKRRRLSPAYDPHMVERLNIAFPPPTYHHNQNQYHNVDLGPGFNPRSVSFDIRTPQELAAVNDFLVTLGRDVTAGSTCSGHTPSPDEESLSGSYFDALGLGQLGLAGMPGMPAFDQDNSYTAPGTYSRGQGHYNGGGGGGALYPSIHGDGSYSPPNDFDIPSHHRPRVSSNFNASHFMDELDLNSAPTHASSTSSFDYLRPSRGPPAVPQLANLDYGLGGRGKVLKNAAQLKSLPTASSLASERSSPKPERAPAERVHRGLPPRLDKASRQEAESIASPLYPLLRSGDAQYKLPPLRNQNHSNYQESGSSPVSSSPGGGSGSDQNAKTPTSGKGMSLPPLHSLPIVSEAIYASMDVDPPTTTESARPGTADSMLADSVRRISIDRDRERARADSISGASKKRDEKVEVEQRRRHAEIIKDLLVTINEDFKRKQARGEAERDDERKEREPLYWKVLKNEGVRERRDVEMAIVG